MTVRDGYSIMYLLAAGTSLGANGANGLIGVACRTRLYYTFRLFYYAVGEGI